MMRFLFAFCMFSLGGLLFAANAAFNDVVAPPELPTQRRSLPCLKCNGTGNVIYLFKKGEEMKLAKNESKKLKNNLLHRKCPVCDGLRSIMRMPTPLEMLTLTKECFNTYRQQNLSNGMHPVGEAFVPKAIYQNLSAEDKADIARRYPPMCKKCWGLGFIPCRRCEGKGKRFDTKNKEKDFLPDDAFIPCTDCNTKGKQECKTCEGAGTPPICKRCQGVGTISQTKKGKTNTDLCKSCNGSGRR